MNVELAQTLPQESSNNPIDPAIVEPDLIEVVPNTRELPDARLKNIVDGLGKLLVKEGNEPIAERFPNNYNALTGKTAYESYKAAQKLSLPDSMRYLFKVAKTEEGEQPIGFTMMFRASERPAGIDPRWPKIASFTCKPYADPEIREAAFSQTLDYARDHFSGETFWTSVPATDTDSQEFLEQLGFTHDKLVDKLNPDDTDLHYTYGVETVDDHAIITP